MAPKNSPTRYQERVSWRYITACMGCFAFITSYGMRTNISVAIVDMVNSTSSTNQESDCQNNSTQEPTETQVGEFDWDQQLQGIILGSFFWGYLLPQTFAGRVAEKYGPKYVILIGGGVATIMTFLGPMAARIHVAFFIVTRFICGLGLCLFAGCSAGNILAMPVSGLLCQHAPDGGWPWAFYFFGLLSAIWLMLWTLLVYNSPDKHPLISNKERNYIVESLQYHQQYKKNPPVPWKKIWTSKAVWAIFAAYFGNAWGNYTMLTELPSYMSNILGFNIQKSGIYSCTPYITAFIIAYITGIILDFLIKKGLITVVIARKFATGFAMYSCGFMLLGVTFLKCQTMATYALLVLAIGLNGTAYSGHLVNAIELSPNFAGTIQGIGNTIGTVPGIISPYITGVITEGQETHQAWAIVFYISFGVLIFFGTIYLLLAEDSVQKWNDIYITNDISYVLPVIDFQDMNDAQKIQ